MLYPQSNTFRRVYNLNGIWDFATVEDGYSPKEPLVKKQLMSVPSSYNDIVIDRALRDYIGKVVYEREFSFPLSKEEEYHLRIGASSHKCEVFVNGRAVGYGSSGFYPIDLVLTDLKECNRLTIVIDNRLTFQTIPPGRIEDGRQTINFDFYNFTGIHRDVLLYTVPQKHIEDIVIHTVVDGDYRKVCVDVSPTMKDVRYTVYDRNKKIVATSNSGELVIENPRLWQCKNAYLYTLRVETGTDSYEEQFGIRKVTYDGSGLYLNDRKLYLKGFGKHEDFYLLGKGSNAAVNVRDFELLKWIGANSIRTSHYPYSEEIMRLADEYGIMVIDEVPAVGMNAFRGDKNFIPSRLNDETKALHKELVKSLIERDKNHPCVIMLSVSNEPATEEIAAREYFKDVIDYTRTLSSLPIMIAEVTKFGQISQVADLVDFTALNRYYGWYEEHGNLYKTQEMLLDEFTKWYEAYKKPILVSEFGADTIEGYHTLPSDAFSEEYQSEFLEENFRAFDKMPFIMGEHVWNFADFKTKQGTIRVRGNRKGVFTRERQPKAAAFTVKKRWEEKDDFIE